QDVPFITFASHPVFWHKEGELEDKATYDMEVFAQKLQRAIETMPPRLAAYTTRQSSSKAMWASLRSCTTRPAWASSKSEGSLAFKTENSNMNYGFPKSELLKREKVLVTLLNAYLKGMGHLVVSTLRSHQSTVYCYDDK
ncbi:hypothetical protein evm_004204, partial [Chilo suppressalis]